MDDDFADYVAARWPALFRTAHLLTGRRESAEDLVQEALVTAFSRWDRIRSMDAPDAYLRKVMLNTYLGERRTRLRRAGRLRLGALPPDPVPDPADGIDLWRGVHALPPRQRAVVVLRYYEDLTEADTAAALGCSVGTVKSQCHRALTALKRSLAEHPTAEEQPS
ncbi:SigE family RNA polymerase sigma factor [Nocardioides sp. GY 10113]|uniref:SigE family RNA polymerase sigma factor n=1 Tax=Nocardioides sp. GY 10113 TaxID=2569761 RepID=UPI0010A797EE|nr:SigE family RNA polymerase sigma factor [Nocardioides sp. GY 10113]TIC85019.1 SigE family RNA polymerase sigma factor [Nocardioides sp. GY 10113]